MGVDSAVFVGAAAERVGNGCASDRFLFSNLASLGDDVSAEVAAFLVGLADDREKVGEVVGVFRALFLRLELVLLRN